MHSFDNSENVAKKNNNWFLLEKFFKKNQIAFSQEEFKDIKNGNFEQLVNFMIKMYKMLTKRQYLLVIIEPLLILTGSPRPSSCLK